MVRSKSRVQDNSAVRNREDLQNTPEIILEIKIRPNDRLQRIEEVLPVETVMTAAASYQSAKLKAEVSFSSYKSSGFSQEHRLDFLSFDAENFQKTTR